MFADASDCFDVRGVFVVDLRINCVETDWRFGGFNDADDFVDFGSNGFFVAIFGDSDRGVAFVVFGDKSEERRNLAKEA